ncbi:hypothetical protein NQ176_g8356 [Zarea fungicola]|uniref:Uncharacterized protein n=1 Tax=Zarea fungicola TaxID=93591 RepID=A0ACC1MTM5_9HYPO|nr:hypothetical protein NQ176_g8356 [Lecanicillium fungicola]
MTSPPYISFGGECSGENVTRSDKRRKISEISSVSIGPAKDTGCNSIYAWRSADTYAGQSLLARSPEEFQAFVGPTSWLQPTVQNYVGFLPDRPEVSARLIPDSVPPHWVGKVLDFFQQWKINGNGAPDRRENAPQKGIGDEHGTTRFLACPFCKYAPTDYPSCLTKQFDAIARLKEHIKRKHMKPICCPRCFDVFETETDRDRHLRRDLRCTKRELRVIQGYDTLNREHQAAMTMRVNTKRTVQEQYNVLFHAFFPGARKPRNPWVDDALLKLMTDWEQFVRQDWRGIRDGMLGHLPPSLTDSEAWTREFGDLIVNAARTELIEEQVSGRARSAKAIPAYRWCPPSIDGVGGAEHLQGTGAHATVATLHHSTSRLQTAADTSSGHDNLEWSKFVMEPYPFNNEPDTTPYADLDNDFLTSIQN